MHILTEELHKSSISQSSDLAAQAALVDPTTNGSSTEEIASNNPRSLMEAILAQKMARASAKFMRSTSTASIDSNCSAKSYSTDTAQVYMPRRMKPLPIADGKCKTAIGGKVFAQNYDFMD